MFPVSFPVHSGSSTKKKDLSPFSKLVKTCWKQYLLMWYPGSSHASCQGAMWPPFDSENDTTFNLKDSSLCRYTCIFLINCLFSYTCTWSQVYSHYNSLLYDFLNYAFQQKCWNNHEVNIHPQYIFTAFQFSLTKVCKNILEALLVLVL